MQSPQQLPPNPPHRTRRSLIPLLLAVILFSLVSAVLVFLTLGAFGSMLLIVAVIFLVAGLHYLIWGWWLGNILRQEELDEQDQSSMEGKDSN